MKTHYKNISGSIKVLKDAFEIKIISHTVSRHLEIVKMTDAELKSPNGGKALYFEHVKDSPFPVATNLFGNTKRICMALGVNNLDGLGDRIRELIEMPPSGYDFSNYQNRVLFLCVQKSKDRGGKYFANTILFKYDKLPFNILILFDADVDLSFVAVFPVGFWAVFSAPAHRHAQPKGGVSCLAAF